MFGKSMLPVICSLIGLGLICAELTSNGDDIPAGTQDGRSANKSNNTGTKAVLESGAEHSKQKRSKSVAGVVNVLLQSCDVLAVANGNNVERALHGITVNITCDAGLKATPATATCTNGSWSTSDVTCSKHRCILLIGGRPYPADNLVEYYHPRESVECDVADIGSMSRVNVAKVVQSSACFMSDREQILIREATDLGDNPPMLYGLTDFSANELLPPYQPDGIPTKASGSVTAAVGGSSCISCGGGVKSGFQGAFAPYLSVCYQFDSTSSEWTTMSAMPQVSMDAASVLMGGRDFYVIGGTKGPRKHSKWLFHYDVVAEMWYIEANMTVKRFMHAAAPLSDTEFIACGGFHQKKSCEIYSTTTKMWRNGGSMIVGRHGFQMFNFNGQVYALGGFRGGLQVEKYDQARDTWSVAKSLKHERSSFEGVVV